jgi:glutamine amidotransferase
MGNRRNVEKALEHVGARSIITREPADLRAADGLLRGTVRRLDSQGLKLPHLGWNEVRWVRESPLLDGLPDPSTFYHVHTYVPHPADDADVLGISDYGSEFASVVARDNVFGAQFHPEKSSAHGLALLRNFARLCDRVAA